MSGVIHRIIEHPVADAATQDVRWPTSKPKKVNMDGPDKLLARELGVSHQHSSQLRRDASGLNRKPKKSSATSESQRAAAFHRDQTGYHERRAAVHRSRGNADPAAGHDRAARAHAAAAAKPTDQKLRNHAMRASGEADSAAQKAGDKPSSPLKAKPPASKAKPPASKGKAETAAWVARNKTRSAAASKAHETRKAAKSDVHKKVSEMARSRGLAAPAGNRSDAARKAAATRKASGWVHPARRK